MAEKHPAPALDDSSARQIRIGWAGGLVFFGAAYFLGTLVGPFGAFLSIWVGIVLAVWGHFPNLFARHIEARLIEGIPYRRVESPSRWIVAILMSIILASVSSLGYTRYLAPKPDPSAAPATISGMRKLFDEYFHPKVNVSQGPSEMLTLYRLFKEDVPGITTVDFLPRRITWRDPTSEMFAWVEPRLHVDFVGGSKFVSFFIPSSKLTKDTCHSLADVFRFLSGIGFLELTVRKALIDKANPLCGRLDRGGL